MWFSQNPFPQLMTGPAGNRILVFAPHPDDDLLQALEHSQHRRSQTYVSRYFLAEKN
jgi:hypothetical protein